MDASSLLPRRFRGSAFLHGKYLTSMEAQFPSTSTEIMRTSVEASTIAFVEVRQLPRKFGPPPWNLPWKWGKRCFSGEKSSFHGSPLASTRKSAVKVRGSVISRRVTQLPWK